jgi:hypothetical protein
MPGSDDGFVPAADTDISHLLGLLPDGDRKPRFGPNSFPKYLPDWTDEEIRLARDAFPVVSDPGNHS